jgi:hypothetical protein
MRRFSKLSLSVGLGLAFAAGILTTQLVARRTAPRVVEPIQTDFCFLARNTTLFVGRRFATSANIVYGIDSEALTSSACPKEFLFFRLTAASRAELSKLPRHGSIGDMTVAVNFEGTIVPRPRLERWRESFWSGSMVELITIEHITSSEANS